MHERKFQDLFQKDTVASIIEPHDTFQLRVPIAY